MSKVAMMDMLLDSNGNKISSSMICEVVDSIFGINLDETPLLIKVDLEEEISPTKNNLSSRVIIDYYLNKFGQVITGSDIRGIINQIFGVNLDAISFLEGARISLYSKNQWVVRQETDLFVVHTGTGDVDVKVYPTPYFKEQTGIMELPTDLKQLLMELGYSYNEEMASYYFSNPTFEPIPDSFKGQTMSAISKVIHQSYSHL